jgi:hypothetical protein
MNKLKKLSIAIAILACASLFTGSASATALQIQFLGYNFQYVDDGPNDYLCPGTGGVCADDLLGLVEFLIDGVSVGTIPSGTAMADWPFHRVDLDGSMPITGGTLNVIGGAFDLNFGGGLFLAIDLTGGTVTYSPGGGGVAASLTGSALGGSIFAQNLPFSLMIGDPLTISFSGSEVTGTGTPSDEGFLQSLYVAGTGEVSGENIPEPGTYALMGAGLLGLAYLRRRRA